MKSVVCTISAADSIYKIVSSNFMSVMVPQNADDNDYENILAAIGA